MSVRFEEMSEKDLLQVAPYCDTVVLTIGGMQARPAHLPFGTSWYIVRRLRDALEMALGGRILTLPATMLGIQGESEGFFTLPEHSVTELLTGLVATLKKWITIRHIVLISDSIGSESALLEGVKQLTENGNEDTPAVVSFIWWRDGVGQEIQYKQSGELETSLLLAVAGRLVDLEESSASTFDATFATRERGDSMIKRLEGELRKKVTNIWRQTI